MDLARGHCVCLMFVLAALAVFHGCRGESVTEPSTVADKTSPPEAAGDEAVADEAAAGCPSLISPREGATLDNGRTDRRDQLVWSFRWSSCTGASAYQLYVKHRGARIPVVNRKVPGTSYRHACSGCYVADVNRFGWFWRVRAQVGGQWRPWSPERSFRVERVNTDPRY